MHHELYLGYVNENTKYSGIRMLSHSVVSDSATPWAVARQAPLSMGFSRKEHWSGLPFPTPRDRCPLSKKIKQKNSVHFSFKSQQVYFLRANFSRCLELKEHFWMDRKSPYEIDSVNMLK